MGTVAEKASKTLDTKREIAAAIEEKTGENPGNVFANYPDAIRSIPTGSGSGWTGHADVEGLKAIGWTDEDIAYYQQYGVNWNEEDDEYHKVPEDNKALYGVINIDNIQDYKDILVYLPKIDTSGKTNLSKLFNNFRCLVAIPMLDMQMATSIESICFGCYSLVCIPPWNVLNVTNAANSFNNCSSLVRIPLDLKNAIYIGSMCLDCKSLLSVEFINYHNIANLYGSFKGCNSIVLITIDLAKIITYTSIGVAFNNCYSLKFIYIKNLKISIDISAASILEKSSLLYTIENAAPTDSITITLSAYCYNKYSADPDVVAALSAQPLVSLASA